MGQVPCRIAYLQYSGPGTLSCCIFTIQLGKLEKHMDLAKIIEHTVFYGFSGFPGFPGFFKTTKRWPVKFIVLEKPGKPRTPGKP